MEVFVARMDFADSVNSAHYELVNVPSEKQVYFESQRDQNDVPDEFAALGADLQVVAHFLDSLSTYLLNSVAEQFQGRKYLFLDLLSFVHVCK